MAFISQMLENVKRRGGDIAKEFPDICKGALTIFGREALCMQTIRTYAGAINCRSVKVNYGIAHTYVRTHVLATYVRNREVAARARVACHKAFTPEDVKHIICFCMRTPAKLTRMLTQLHFALVSWKVRTSPSPAIATVGPCVGEVCVCVRRAYMRPHARTYVCLVCGWG